MMRDNLTSGSIEFRKAYIRSVFERIECEDNLIRIVGNKTTLEQLIAGAGKPPRLGFAVLNASGAPYGSMESVSEQTSDARWETIASRSIPGLSIQESPTYSDRAMNCAASRASRFLFAARV